MALLAMCATLGCSGGGGSDDGGDDGSMTGPPSGGGQTLGSITTNVATLNLVAGGSGAITVTALDVNNQPISNPSNPTFSSAHPTVAEVTSTGVVLGISQGNTQVTVSLTMGAVTRTATVDVAVTGALPSSADVIASSGDYVFTPAVVAIGQGGSVTWTFGGLEHTVTFASVLGAPSNITGGYATSVSRNFDTAGDYSYVCTIHVGMSGRVIVR